MAALLLFALAACSTNEGTKGNMKSTDAFLVMAAIIGGVDLKKSPAAGKDFL